MVRFAGFEVDFAQREVRKRGMRVHLQNKPFQVLELLLRKPGSLVTREEMARHLWPDSHVCFERGLNTAVNALRQALGDSSQGSRFIETRAGLGYCFVAPVEQILAPGLKQARAANENVHDDCSKGRYFLDKMTEADAHKAMAHFEAALLEDARSAEAYAGLADGWCEFARLSMASSRVAGEKAKEFAIHALSNNSGRAEAHLAMARVKMLFESDAKGARAEFLRALELDENCAAAHGFYSSFLATRNETETAERHMKTARLMDPLSLRMGVEHAWMFYAERQFDKATEQAWNVLSLEPRAWMAQLVLGFAYEQLGMREEAVAELENAVACSGRNPVALGAMGHIYGIYGAGAETVLEELNELALKRYVNPVSLALVHAGLGQEAQTLDCLRRARAERDVHLHWLKFSAIPQMAGII
jgi:DNA-binding winged helix-turn-helix (wHTH) protein/Flp pilus assembly protein TadD